MISKEIVKLQKSFVDLGGCSMSLDKQTQRLVVQLLDVTHSQWLYRNMYVHNATVGMEANTKKRKRYSDSLRIS